MKFDIKKIPKKVLEEFDERDNKKNLNNKLEDEQPIQRFDNDIPEEEEKNIYDFVVLKYEPEKVNILIKSFYNNFNEKNIFKEKLQKLPKKLKIWKDDLFNEEKALGKIVKKVPWLRPEKAGNKNYCIIKDKPDIKNIKQSSNIDDCFFLSALGALCSNPKNTEFIKNLFHITERTKEKAYGIYFYINGVRQLILIDDFLAYSYKRKNLSLYYSSSFEKSELWVSFIEKALAKLKGSYENVKKSTASYAFEALTGAFTKQYKINEYKKEKIWEKLRKYKKENDYLICAGTKMEFSLVKYLFRKGLEQGHEYTLIEIIENEKEQKVKLKDPYGDKFDKGIFTIDYEDFYNYFAMLEVNFFKPDLVIIPINITKEESMRFQIIQIDNEYENNEIYINLYQKNKTFSYIMLIQKKEEKDDKKPNYIYIKSITSLNNKGEYQTHFGLKKINLKKGIYYICCDVNYRFLDNEEIINDYLLNIYSKKDRLLKVENITSKMELNEKLEIFGKTINNFINGKIQYDKKPKLYLFNYNEKFPFDIYCFKNTRDKKIKIEFKINEEINKQYCFYNDKDAEESTKTVTKVVDPNQSIILCVMKYKFDLIGKNYLKYNNKVVD